MDIESPAVIDDFSFKIYWSFDPVSDFEPIVDSVGNEVEIDGAVGPLSYTHDHIQYNFNKARFYKILVIEKADPLHQLFSDTLGQIIWTHWKKNLARIILLLNNVSDIYTHKKSG